MPINSARIIESRVQYHVSRVSDSSIQAIFERHKAELSERLNDISIKGLVFIASRLEGMASWYSTLGISELADGRLSGWDSVRLALNYLTLSSCIFVERSRQTSSATLASGKSLADHYKMFTLPHINKMVGCLSFCSIIGAGTLSNQLGNHLVEVLTSSNIPKTTSLAYLGAWLFEKTALRAMNASSDRFGTYDEILKAWNHPTQFANAIVRCCDYHCHRIKPSASDMTDFGLAPFDLIPYEIFFVLHIRKVVGLIVPDVSHPLLDSLYAHPPKYGLGHDETFERVYNVFNEVRAKA